MTLSQENGDVTARASLSSASEEEGEGLMEIMSKAANGRIFSIIIVLSKYRLSLARLEKPNNVRIYVVAPPRILHDETNVDVYYQVEVPISENDHRPMIQKARELASMYSTTRVRLVAFERNLQRVVAKLRYEMDIEGFTHEQIDTLMRLREMSQITRRNGLVSPRQITLSGSPQPEVWIETLHTQLGPYPLYVRPTRSTTDFYRSIIGVSKLDCDEDTRRWIKQICSPCSPSMEWIFEECYEDGAEFTVMCTSIAGMHCCCSTVDHGRSLFDSISSQLPYALQLYSVDQTRDLMPGLESFAMQTTKALFANKYSGAIFIRGFYRGHNDIFLLGVELEPSSDCLRHLLALPKESPGWECVSLHSLYAVDASELDYPSRSSPSDSHHLVINVPSTEGMLIHQTTIPKRRTSCMRVCWRAPEGQDLRDADGVDASVVQVFMMNSDNSRLLEEARDVMTRVDIPIDRNPIMERQAAYRRHVSRLTPKESYLTRSSTTHD